MVVIASSKRYSDFNASSHGRIKQHIDAVIFYACKEQDEQPLDAVYLFSEYGFQCLPVLPVHVGNDSKMC